MKNPEEIMFDKSQWKELKLYLKISTKPNKEEVALSLNKFFNDLDPIQKKIIHHWFNYQLSEIDHKLLPCLKIAQFANEHQLEKNISIHKNGEKIFLVLDNEREAKELQEKFLDYKPNFVAISKENKSLPALEFNLKELNSIMQKKLIEQENAKEQKLVEKNTVTLHQYNKIEGINR